MNRRRTHRVRGKGWLCASTFGPEHAGIFRRDHLSARFRFNTLINANAVDAPMRVVARPYSGATSQDLAERLGRERLDDGFLVRRL